jgi:hypothetical protein
MPKMNAASEICIGMCQIYHLESLQVILLKMSWVFVYDSRVNIQKLVEWCSKEELFDCPSESADKDDHMWTTAENLMLSYISWKWKEMLRFQASSIEEVKGYMFIPSALLSYVDGK